METIRSKIAELETRILKAVSEPENDRYPIYDGAVNQHKYLNSKFKIAWLLKEAYCDKDGTGGNWHYSKLLDKDTLFEDFFKPHPSKATWYPIVYISYAILNSCECYNDMDDIDDDPTMARVVREIAIINAQKLPARQHTITDGRDILEAVEKYGDILLDQIELLNPEILIGGNTMQFYKTLFGLKEEDRTRLGSVSYWIKNNRIYIDAFHPAQTTINRFTYVDDILKAVDIYIRLK